MNETLNTTMNTTNMVNRKAPLPLLSTTTRVASALAVVAFVAAAWASAGTESHKAVDTTTATLNRHYITLDTVTIVAQRTRPAASVATTPAPRTAL